MTKRRYPETTAGEKLFQYIACDILDEGYANQLCDTQALQIGGRSNDLGQYFYGFNCCNIFARLIRKTERVIQQDRPDPARIITQYAESHLEITNRIKARRLSALALAANKSAGRSIPYSVGLAVIGSRILHHCYICGNSISKSKDDESSKLELEHIWPSSYGGDSIEENILPACGVCNRNKADMLLWYTGHLAGFCLKPQPSVSEQVQVKRREKIAWFMRNTYNIAIKYNISLKNAALQHGPIDMDDQKSIDEEDSLDFFNLTF
jgi:5-methylcytosine-specific restriction endonuclease McrA